MDKLNSHNNEKSEELIRSFMQFKQIDWERNTVEGYKPSEMRVLICIDEEARQSIPEIKVTAISKILRVSPPSITPLLNKLEMEGLVERRMDASDRRVVLVRLTKAGKDVALKGRESFVQTFSKLYEFLGEEDSKELARLLTKTYIFFSEKDM